VGFFNNHIHAYHTCFIPVAEAFQISETPTFYQNDLALRNTADITGVVINPLPSNRSRSQHAKYEFATLNTCSIASIVATDILWKMLFGSFARGASFHTKHASNANVVQVVLLDTNSYLAHRSEYCWSSFGVGHQPWNEQWKEPTTIVTIAIQIAYVCDLNTLLKVILARAIV
jgi:hypothetical protein